MLTRIGFIISLPLEPVIQEIVSELRHECLCNIYIAEEPYHAYQIYRQHLNETDLYIFSGKMFLYTVGGKEAVYQKPCYTMDGITTNIKDIILDLFIKDRSIDFRRIFIDVAYNDYNYLGLKELLPPDEQPHFLDMNVPELKYVRASGPEMMKNFNEYVYQTHLKMHREGVVDLSLTRFGTLTAHFEKHGIPYRYIHPTREYIINFVRQCLSEHQPKHLLSSSMSAFVIRLSASARSDTGHLIQMIEQIFTNYANTTPADYQISRAEHSLEIIMPADTLARLTDNYQDMQIAHTLLQSFDESLECCGFGRGKTVTEALFNAHTAAEAGRGTDKQIFFINEEGKITGPLGADSVTIDSEPDNELRLLAKQLDVPHRNLQKIIAFSKISNTKTVTSEDISRYLQITRKSGNRILNKIVENGGAVIYNDNMNGGKGRPKKYYELTFLDTLKD